MKNRVYEITFYRGDTLKNRTIVYIRREHTFRAYYPSDRQILAIEKYLKTCAPIPIRPNPIITEDRIMLYYTLSQPQNSPLKRR